MMLSYIEEAEKLLSANYDYPSDAIAALATALDNAYGEGVRAAEWQDISTAPKDGTEIILAVQGLSGAGFYSANVDDMRRADAGWFWESDRDNLLVARNANPTHWMPIPPPPAD